MDRFQPSVTGSNRLKTVTQRLQNQRELGIAQTKVMFATLEGGVIQVGFLKLHSMSGNQSRTSYMTSLKSCSLSAGKSLY